MLELPELPDNNLYVNGRVIDYSDVEAELERIPVDYKPTEKDAYHTVVQGDSLDRIAYDRYKGIVPDPSKYWWVIADANLEVIDNPLDISDLIGTDLVIPDILRFKLLLWKRLFTGFG